MTRYFGSVFCALCLFISTHGQDLVDYKIADSGCRVKLQCDSVEFTPIEFEDNHGYLSDECIFDNNEGSGVVYMKFWRPLGLLDDPYGPLILLLDNLKYNFNIVSANGYSKVFIEQPGKRQIYAMRDDWVDKEGTIFKVKGYTNGNHTGIMYYYHPPVDNPFDFMEEDEEILKFLDGFTLPVF